MTNFAEIREFGSFEARTQRYIRRSLDIGFERGSPEETWGRDAVEIASIRAQTKLYRDFDIWRKKIPSDPDITSNSFFIFSILPVSMFDLAQGSLSCFSSYRFLYERLLGARARPWLPAAFCAAASMPQLNPERREALLLTISKAVATAPGWSKREPTFFPEWVEKVEV